MFDPMEYVEYLQTAWTYFPYLVYTFVFLTLLPKSLCRIKSFADADYEANRNKFHRCYGPDLCCHTLAEALPKQKARKAVTRVYPKKSLPADSPTHQQQDTITVKRQVQASAIQTRTNVNQIAKMFENAGRKGGRKVNRVTPTILPEIRTHSTERAAESGKKFEQLSHEDIENSVNLLNQSASTSAADLDWRAEPIVTVQRRTRATPTSLSFAGTSATPSTASPAASSPHSSPLSGSPLASPVLRSAPLNMKSSLEDIFAAIARSAETSENFIYGGCNSLSPVTSIDDILSQRRLSRPLSAYSISDLLNEESPAGREEAYVENFLRTLNKA